MADGGLRQFISYLFNLMRCDNGSASNAISAQISKTLAAILKDTLKKNKTHNLRPIKNNLRRLLRVKNALFQDNFKIKKMYKSILTIFSIAIFSISCNSSRNLANIQPKTGNLDISAKGELRVWNNIKHSSFDVVLTNTNENQSCELYYVKSNGTEKWINPSLQAKSSVTVNIPTDGHLFIKNFNPNNLTISYKINE